MSLVSCSRCEALLPENTVICLRCGSVFEGLQPSKSPLENILRVNVFISSPGDVRVEREIAIKVIEKLNRNPYIRAKYLLYPLAYEHNVPPASGKPAQTVVDQYMGRSIDSYIFIAIFSSRMGTPFLDPETNRRYLSGTEYEFITAYEQYIKIGRPHILLYRRQPNNDESISDQNHLVDAFFARFEKESSDFEGLYKKFEGTNDFEDMLYDHISQIIYEHPPVEDAPVEQISRRAKIQEEVRRLDAAIPELTQVDVPTEIWAQICLPNSSGFKNSLPHYTEHGDEIKQGDITGSELSIAFPIDVNTGKPTSVILSIKVNAPEFDLETNEQQTRLIYQNDSALIIFHAIPKRVTRRSPVSIVVTMQTSDGYHLTVGSVALNTKVIPQDQVRFSELVWRIASIPLSTLGVINQPASDNSELLESPKWGSARFSELPKLVFIMKDIKQKEILINLNEKSEWIIGRYSTPENYPDIDLGIDSKNYGVSERHFIVKKESGAVVILDLKSVNGTYLNGQKLIPEQPYILRDGDRIHAGQLTIMVTFR